MHTALHGMGMGSDLERMWHSVHILLQMWTKPTPTQQPLSRVGMVEEDLDAQDTAEKGTDTQQRWMGTYEFLTVHSRSLTLDHQQP